MERASGALACGSGGGGFPGRAVESMDKQLERCRFAMSKSKTFVATIERAADALSLSCSMVKVKPCVKVMTIETALQL
jgi:hypothetical protein